MRTHALRLRPGQDLRQVLYDFAAEQNLQAAIVLTRVGSLKRLAVRFAGEETTTIIVGKFEIVSIAGTLESGGGHLHLAVSNHLGQTLGGQLKPGCLIYTTAEIVLAELAEWSFQRELDPQTGYKELHIVPRQSP